MIYFETKVELYDTRQELEVNEMAWRLPLHTETGDGYSDDIPENV